MKANRLAWTFLLLLQGAAAFQLRAQQTDADRKLLAEIRARADRGNAQSQHELGCAFDFAKLGVETDPVAAVKWYRKAADQNHGKAQFHLACCYRKGNGVEQDYVTAVKWFRKAAEQNDPQAQFNLAH